MAKRLSREKALPVGVSSGANVLASIQILNEIRKEKKVVTLLPDRTERYFSTDLYAPSDRKVRQWSKTCVCPFE
jgi:cysteine synthase